MPSPQECIETYVRAKDENRPYLMPRVFDARAQAEMVVRTEAISFPPTLDGLDTITDTLVRRFGASFENVHTFCLATPPQLGARNFSCDWLVGMSDKNGHGVRVGCGKYDWRFAEARTTLIERLTITVEFMQSLAPMHLQPVMQWLSELPYPWCDARVAHERMPAFPDLKDIRARVAGIVEQMSFRSPGT